MNRLANETSAYLRQHRTNPVDWYPWGAEALERARAEDKPLLVSIGYSACHWCHVMERESFEDPDTAARMNELFVCIKVDREERPDVDQIYMNAVTRIVGRGGWPLTAFCKPGGEPFYGGTYFPPERRHGMPAFRDVLEAIARAYREQRDEVDDTAQRLLEALDERATGTARGLPGVENVSEAARRLLRGADREQGGFGVLKFPTPPSLDLLLAAADSLPEDEARDAVGHVALTCRAMARGGIYDHLGGGFHRYSVDGRWSVPHFEKMLYDEGQLLRVYAETWRRTGREDADLVWPIRETVAFLRREMRGPEGAFYASLDADSEGEEGLFYVWRPDELSAALGARAAAEFARAYGVTDAGNFEGSGATVLFAAEAAPRERHRTARDTLRKARSTRVRPDTDEKRVAAWNGLAISGLARAGSLLGDDEMLRDAASAADYVIDHMIGDDGQLRRVSDGHHARVPAFLDDLAGMLEACLDLHRAGAGDAYLSAALGFAEDIAQRFYDSDESDLFLTPCDGEPLIHRPRSDHDGATPHSAGWATLGLLRTATLCGRADLRVVVDAVLRTHAFALDRAPEAFPTLARAAAHAERGLSVAVIVGAASDPETARLADAARRGLRPEDAVVVADPKSETTACIDPELLANRTAIDGSPTAFVCRGTECSLPVRTAAELEALCVC